VKIPPGSHFQLTGYSLRNTPAQQRTRLGAENDRDADVPCFCKEECTQALLDFLSYTDVDRVSAVAEEAENSDHEESSDGGV
jgi:hypothetical protein